MTHPTDYHNDYSGVTDIWLVAQSFREIQGMMFGERIGWGTGRTVYVFRPDPSLVIKMETGSHSFQNIIEWETWDTVKYNPKLNKWYAACKTLSPSGNFLLMERGEPVRRDEMPNKVPACMCDLKPENFVRLADKRIVACDYGLRFAFAGKINDRLVNAKWED